MCLEYGIKLNVVDLFVINLVFLPNFYFGLLFN